MIHSSDDSIHSWPDLRRFRPAPTIGFSTGDIVAIMPTSADASRAVGTLAGLGIADTSIEAGESLGEPTILVVRRPGRERIADIRACSLPTRLDGRATSACGSSRSSSEPGLERPRNGPAERRVASPLNQLPDLRLQVARTSTDLREQGNRELQMNHRLVTSALLVKKVGQVVFKSRLSVAIALTFAPNERVASQLDRLGAITRVGSDKGEGIERGDPHARVDRGVPALQ
jgi:hypothetical protein